jgi:ADP-ribosylglycohydrolase
MNDMDSLARARGAVVGLAVGDALGAAVEFKGRGTFAPVTGYRGGGAFGLAPGEWTDDTSMALCLAESLIEREGFDPLDQLERYLRWYREGHLSVTGACFDIGGTTAGALGRFERTRAPYCGSTDPHAAGNGSLMRLAPVPVFFAADPAAAVARSGDSSRTTHAAAGCVDACRYYGGLIAGALRGASREELLSPMYAPVPGLWDAAPLAPEIEAVARGSFLRREPPEIRGTGYVVQSLEAALWSFSKAWNFRDAVLHAVNLGDDADTTGAICGQLAGAHHGFDGIPAEWREGLAKRDLVLDLVDRLVAARPKTPRTL